MTDQRKPVAAQIFGDNRAPVEDVLNADFADLTARAEAMAQRLQDEAPDKVDSDEDMLFVGRLITDARALAKELEAERSDQSGPLFQAKKKIDGFFKDLTALIERAEKPLRDRADDYTRRKAAEEREIARRKAEEARRREEEARRKSEEAKSAEAGGRAAARAETYAAQADAEEKSASEARTKVSGGGVTASGRAVWTFHIDDYAALDLNDLKPFIDRKAVEQAIRSYVRIQKDQARLKGVSIYQDTKTQFRG